MNEEKRIVGAYICSKKRLFRTKKKAWKQAVYDFTRSGLLLTAYHCKYCERYHLTTARTSFSFPNEFIDSVEKWLGFKIPN